MNKEEIDNLEDYLRNYLPKIEPTIPITNFGSVNLEDLMDSIKQFKKVPTFDELLRENEKLKEQSDEKEQKIRLDQTKKVFEVLADAIKNGSISYRNLIYDKLGFTEHYADLIAGLTITNAIVDLEEKGKIINEILKECFYVCDCPVSRLDEDTNKLCNLLDCENCQENYKECWLKYFENKVLEGSKTT